VVVSTAKGNLGEHLLMAELINRDFHAFMADRGNAGFDLSTLWSPSGRKCVIRVKTTSNHSAVWTVKKSGQIFLELQEADDFVAIVDLGAGLRERDIYIVPTIALLECLQQDHEFYVSHKKKDGNPRKQEQGMRNVCFYGTEKPTDRCYGYQEKFAQYREAWDLLK
jgi:hypothetical protein